MFHACRKEKMKILGNDQEIAMFSGSLGNPHWP